MPPNANIFQPGPAFVYVTINGIPSNGSYVIVGSGKVETQTMNSVDTLPASVRVDSASGTGSPTTPIAQILGNNNASSLSMSGGTIGGIVAGVAAVLAIFGTIGFFILRRRRVAAQRDPSGTLLRMRLVLAARTDKPFRQRDSDSASFPLCSAVI
jgi:hypothetical protein